MDQQHHIIPFNRIERFLFQFSVFFCSFEFLTDSLNIFPLKLLSDSLQRKIISMKFLQRIHIFKAAPDFRIFHQYLTDIIILYITAVDFFPVINRGIRIITTIHIVRLIHDHRTLCINKSLEIKTIVLERCSRSFVMSDVMLLQKLSFVNTTPGIHDKT